MRCAGIIIRQFRGCPRNCKRRVPRLETTGPDGGREGDGGAMTREPGDLPSFAVTGEHVGRGVPMGSASGGGAA
jgi:hypothetical protein